MGNSRASIITPLFFALSLILFLQVACTRSEISGRVSSGTEGAESDSRPSVKEDIETEPVQVEIYDLEDEALVDDELDESFEQLEDPGTAESDTFSVKDVFEGAVYGSGFDTGYRIQVFASADLDKAKELKNNVIAGTGLAVYVEFEGGLYKVRVGDYRTREAASQARTRFVELYPDCWIVSTTIRK